MLVGLFIFILNHTKKKIRISHNCNSQTSDKKYYLDKINQLYSF